MVGIWANMLFDTTSCTCLPVPPSFYPYLVAEKIKLVTVWSNLAIQPCLILLESHLKTKDSPALKFYYNGPVPYGKKLPSRSYAISFTPKFNYVQYKSGEKMLFDLISDPDENINIAGDPKRKSTLNHHIKILRNGWTDALPPSLQK